ncbi:UDP-N-acetyl-D-glucosamine 2-epimerase, UDP-hydrolysing [Tannerella sp. oral taxon 808]|nr:UDP-N-acetyl-D-glucosamine 2-epimerase, UDP-hydrolysing [Tannerella sp. oral taxon 808]
MRKVCVVTGTRAEYGLLSRLMWLIGEDHDLTLQIIATNMHLSPEFGLTYKEIEADGFTIDKKVPMHKLADTSNGIVKSMAVELSGIADAYEELRPDLIVLLGDRYEMLIAATAALIYKIPIAHIHGGEITEGAFDDAIRHAITKMSHLHFTSTEEYSRRVIQLGEQPDRVFYVGSLGVENIKKITLMSKDEIEKSLGFELNKKTVIATYHPATLTKENNRIEMDEFLTALDEEKNIRILFTMPNSDPEETYISKRISEFTTKNKERAVAFTSLGVKRYLSVIKHVAAVIGNSSSGIIEAPSLGIPTLNIGDRQKGRVTCDSIISCYSDKDSIRKGLKKVLSEEMVEIAKEVRNPYEKENTAQSIFNVIKSFSLNNLTQKPFYNL